MLPTQQPKHQQIIIGEEGRLPKALKNIPTRQTKHQQTIVGEEGRLNEP